MNKVFFKTLISNASERGFQRHNPVFMMREKRGARSNSSTVPLRPFQNQHTN